MNKNDRGFTLIELIVGMVIFAIVVAAAFGFMLASSRTYKAQTERINMQLNSEIAMNQLGNFIIDCNAGIYFPINSNILFIIDKNSDGTYTANVFELEADHCIYYRTGPATSTGSGTFSYAKTSDNLLAENVTSFSVAVTSSDGVTNSSAVVSLSLTKGTASYSGSETFALRNKPAIVTNVTQTG